jgi:hypothetical protein
MRRVNKRTVKTRRKYKKKRYTRKKKGGGLGSGTPIDVFDPDDSTPRRKNTRERKNSLIAHEQIQPIQIACPDSGVCLALGTYSNEINTYFKGFIDFNYVKNVERIGKSSTNGFINQIEYKRGDYSSYAILKSSKTPISDNLMYEYMVGRYVNQLNQQYPCFLETYGLFEYKKSITWKNMQENKINKSSILADLSPIEIDYARACQNSQYLAILIQNLKDVQTLGDLMSNQSFLDYELLLVLFQIYVPLSQLSTTFTHYDLHENNVLLYEPVPGKYITYHYTIPGEEEEEPILFNSKYMAKIIDYGRCYFNDSDNDINSESIYRELCAERKCNNRELCGNRSGFLVLDNQYLKEGFYIESKQKNISHDLLLLSRILKNYKLPHFLTKMLNSLEYKTLWGTPEIQTPTLEERIALAKLRPDGKFSQINNVNDAAKTIINNLYNYPEYANNDYSPEDKFGDLYITHGEPMRFVPTI